MPWQTDRPRPVPAPTGLVVKKGSSTRSRSSTGTPGPLSATSMRTTPAPARVRARGAAAAGTSSSACWALTTRLRNTWPSWSVVGHRRRQIGRVLALDLDAGAAQPIGEVEHPVEHLVHVDRPGRRPRLVSGERQEGPDDAGAALRRGAQPPERGLGPRRPSPRPPA